MQKEYIAPLSRKNKFCYSDVRLEGGGFINKENHVFKFNSSQRPCNKDFPLSIIKTIGGNFVSQEPDLMSIEVMNNYTISGILSFSNSTLEDIDFMQDNEGLLTAAEWNSLTESIKYSGLRSMLTENLMTSLCLDQEHCKNLISGIHPAISYNPAVLNLPSEQEIKDRILEELNLNWYDRFMNWVQKQAAIICTVTLLIQILIFFLTVVDFIIDSNEANILRVLLNLMIRITLKLTSCCCKYNPFRKLNNKKRLGANQGINLETENSNIIRWGNQGEVIPHTIEMQPLGRRVFAALEDLS